MSTPIVTFFNNRNGIGKTSLVYNLAWMYADLGYRVLAVDLDPQLSLSDFFLDEDQIQQIWHEEDQPNTIYRCIQPFVQNEGNIATPTLIEVERESVELALLTGDMGLWNLEDTLAAAWHGGSDRSEQDMETLLAFRHAIQKASADYEADVVLIDTSANLDALNRTILANADYLAIPIASDPYSIHGLKTLGATLNRWRQQWIRQIAQSDVSSLSTASDPMQTLGYIATLYTHRHLPLYEYQYWLTEIPALYQEAILQEPLQDIPALNDDGNRLITLQYYRDLMSMAWESHKPIFYLKPADGVVGSHYHGVLAAYRDFKALAQEIGRRINLRELPQYEYTTSDGNHSVPK